ncbi:MAG: YhgE/Pip domain-containing protein [Eggerthellaceae bacterium]|nr:YhgE/Pip domain-containing protein [Eggerthellaceae bacterium]
MGNVLRILKRDILRLLKAPAALIVVGALLLVPSLYTWYNVVAFWDPYGNTGNFRVCVVNEDEGVTTDATGEINVGDKLTEELLANDMLEFVQADREAAMDKLKSGDVYAVYMVPSDFSECLVSPITGDIKHPQIEYYVNEKLSPISPKITDAGANALEQNINSMFVQTVSDVAVETLDDKLQEARDDVSTAESKATSKVNEAVESINQVRDSLSAIEQATVDAQDKVANARSALYDAQVTLSDASVVLQDVSNLAQAVQGGLANAASIGASSLPVVLSDISQVATLVSTAANQFLASAGAAKANVDMAVSQMETVVVATATIAADLHNAASLLPDGTPGKEELDELGSDIEEDSRVLQENLDAVSAASDSVYATSQAISDASNALNDLAQQTIDSAQRYSDELFYEAIPSINNSLSQLSIMCADLSVAISNQQDILVQADLSLNELDAVLANSREAVSQTDGLMTGLEEDLDQVSSDVLALGESGVIADLVRNGSLDPDSISEFMGSPTELKTQEFYHLKAYGSGMAPLFMNLTCWIGAFALMIIMRLEVDTEGLPRITSAQRYLSRLILFSGLVVAQSIICCIGVLYLGVQTANIPALFIASAVASLAYLSLIYFLSVTFQHVGKGLCIVLVFAQIPGASGLYPVELTSKFFQAIYPFLPFTYGINAMREAIGGFYGFYFVHDLLVLGLIFLTCILLGVFLQPRMANVNHMVADQIRESDLYHGETVVTPRRSYWISEAFKVLLEREDYRKEITERYESFSRNQSILTRISIVVGLTIAVVMAVVVAVTATEKVVLLTVVLVLMVTLFILLIVGETMRYGLEQRLGLSNNGSGESDTPQAGSEVTNA